MKKIVHIMNGLDQGGTEKAFSLLLNALHSNYQFHVIVLNQSGYYSEKIESMGIPIHYLSITKNPLCACRDLYQHLHRIQPDIVHTWLYHADLIGGIFAKLCGVKKIIWSIRCEGIGLKKSTQWIQRACALLSQKIPQHITVNSQSAADSHRQIGYPQHKINLIYNGFDTSEFYPKPPKLRSFNDVLSVPEDIIIFGTLARYHPDKDYNSLLQIIDEICQTDPHILFVLCGQGCTTLKNQVDKLTYAHQVLLLNGVSHTHRYLNTLDIFIQSSKTESFSNSLVEAMLCGLPCIATDVGETAKICNEYAIIIPKENPKQLAKACLDMLKKSPDERKKLGELARKHIEQCYSIEPYKQQIRNLYDAV